MICYFKMNIVNALIQAATFENWVAIELILKSSLLSLEKSKL
jgi:hypothetical protein